MAFFPFRRDRRRSDELLDALNDRLDRDGLSFLALERKADGRTIGFTGLARLDPGLPMAPGIEIGWRLLPEHWGRGYVTEAAPACLDRAFARGDVAEVVSFCVAANTRSEAVMRRLGFRPSGAFDHPSVDRAAHPGLVPHVLYRLGRDAWLARRSEAPAVSPG